MLLPGNQESRNATSKGPWAFHPPVRLADLCTMLLVIPGDQNCVCGQMSICLTPPWPAISKGWHDTNTAT
eukprot:4012073-Ditylum_brightwellii.AAC.1